MNDKIIDDELMTDEELDKVAGGNFEETLNDADELRKRGLLSDSDLSALYKVDNILHNMGYSGYQSRDVHNIGDNALNNIYTDKKGNQITRAEFWANFDSENGK